MIGIDSTAPMQTSNRLLNWVGSENGLGATLGGAAAVSVIIDSFDPRSNASHTAVQWRLLCSNLSTSAQFSVRANAAEPSRETLRANDDETNAPLEFTLEG